MQGLFFYMYVCVYAVYVRPEGTAEKVNKGFSWVGEGDNGTGKGFAVMHLERGCWGDSAAVAHRVWGQHQWLRGCIAGFMD